MAIGLVGSAVILFVILGRYVYTRQQFLSWDIQYGETSIESDSPADGAIAHSVQPGQSIYDRWLLIRFTVGFFALG